MELLLLEKEQRQNGIERRTVAARKDRDVAGRRAVDTSGNRHVRCAPAPCHHLRSEPLDLVRVSRRHFQPYLARRHAVEQPVRAFDNRGGRGGRGQAGDGYVAAAHQRRWGFCRPCAPRDEIRDARGIEVAHRQVDSVAQQRSGKPSARAAQSDPRTALRR
jgi:hypothetical protein